MATLTATQITVAGADYVLGAAAAAGDAFLNSEKEFIVVKNAHVSEARTVTIASTHKCSYNFAHDISVSVAAGTTEMIGVLPVKWFNNSDDMVTITYSDAGADLTIGVFRL